MSGSHILVVGGTRGIGRNVVSRFLKEGDNVSIIARRAATDAGHLESKQTRYWQADIAQPDQVNPALAEIVQTRGKIQGLVFLQRFRGEGDTWEGELSVSVKATRDIIDSLSGQFTESGSIVVVNSNAAEIVVDEQPLSYHVAKAALLQLVRYYAMKLGPENIRVNGVCPITTLKLESQDHYLKNPDLMNLYKKMIPLGRLGTADEVANVIAFLCSKESSFLTGQNLTVDGGISLRGHEALARILEA